MKLEAPRRTIWIVDDSAVDCERVKRLLGADYDVVTMPDGAVALEKLSAGSAPDLMLLDWVMPQISGVEVCRYVRKAPGKLAQIPIILLTANHGSRDIEEAFASGANDYVSKPFVDEELRARVAVLLNAKRLLERAERAEADLLSLLSTSPDPMFAMDAEGRVTFVNSEGCRVLDRGFESLVGTSFATLLPGLSAVGTTHATGDIILPPADVQVGDRVFSPSVRNLSSDGSSSTTVALRDVTTRRKFEARRLDFYSVIAHDLRTPITAVLLRLQLAFHGQHGVLPAGLLSDLQRSETNLRSLVGMINDFLDLAKFEGVGYKIDRGRVELGPLIQTLLDDYEPLFASAELKLEVEGLASSLATLGDEQRLSQVVSNLIGNAIKFTAPGGRVTVSLRAVENAVEVSVADTGRGIARTELPKIFDRFTRAGESVDAPGTGLGLMIVREVVEAHGGTIGVESELGVGSRFWVRLPAFVEAKA